MALNTAHEGYEYQDILTAFFILKELLEENDSTFKIDDKEYKSDKFDDLTIINKYGKFKKQIKYSNHTTNKTAVKKNFATSNTYDLAFYDLFRSWNNSREDDIRLCLAWNEPIDELRHFLKTTSVSKTFENFNTKVFKIDIETLWKDGELPNKSWRKFKTESTTINRDDFKDFCEKLIIEMEFPKISSNTEFTGELEQLLLKQIEKLGIGEYPNNSSTPKQFAFELVNLIRRSRSKGFVISTKDIFEKFNIITDFGSIEQVFPIDENKNIKTDNFLNQFISTLAKEQKLILKGEPGSGKSWFIQNLQQKLKDENYQIIRHYCYTELKDTYFKERITLDVFYGNLIKDILDSFPELKEEKEQRYASNLTELNNLLTNIDKETVLIIDGLDHIERVFSYSQTDLTLNDIAIIQAIGKLNFSEKVKVVIASQPIERLNELLDYKHYPIPKWELDDVLAYFSKNNISDIEITKNENLSDILLQKSAGNPLYLSYLTEEIRNLSILNLEAIEKLPPYNYNLKAYYEYLIRQLDISSIPQVLSGVNFSLSTQDLKEITGQGKKVEKTIKVLKPILNEKVANGGFIIYHESFRRFILEGLEEDEINVSKAIFSPIINWFKEKGFFEFPKAYRFYLPLLYNEGFFEEILEYLTVDFIVESVYHGYSFEVVVNNYNYLSKAVIHQKDFPKIILANEINKVLGSTEDEYYDKLDSYFSALGHIKGFKAVSDYLIFDGEPTLLPLSGLKVCYLCSNNNEPTYWGMYFEYFNEKEIEFDEFKYYVKGLLVMEETPIIIDLAKQLLKDTHNFISIFQYELINHQNNEYVELLKKEDVIISEILNYKEIISRSDKDLLTLTSEIIKIIYLSEKELSLIEDFFQGLEQNIDNQGLIQEVINQFKTINWFYNWIIYYIKIKVIQYKNSYNYSELLAAFEYLSYDTEPFKGKPRTSDLHQLEDVIHNSITEGLSYIKKSSEWIEIIDLLVKVSNRISTSFQGSLMSVLSTNKLFNIFDKNANNDNREKIIQTFEEIIEDTKEYYLHTYISDFYFLLSKQYSIQQNIIKADIAFKNGIQFLFGYTMRRDRTLEDVLDSLEKYSTINYEKANEYIKKSKSLVDSVIRHTDGKDTKYFPVEWFEVYYKINFKDAALYLLSNIKNHYYWIYEEQLQDLLIETNGNTNVIIELFLFLSFPIQASEDFLKYGLNLVKQSLSIDAKLSEMLLQNIFERATNKRNTELNQDFVNQFNSVSIKHKLKETQKEEFKPSRKNIFDTTIENIKFNSVVRQSFSDMTMDELIEFCSTRKLSNKEVNSLCYVFVGLDSSSSKVQKLINTIIEKHEQYPKDENVDLSILMKTDNDTFVRSLVSNFVNKKDGWFNNLVRIDDFTKAYSLNAQLTTETLIEQLPKFIEPQKYGRSVSSNLINALVTVDYPKEVIEKMWDNLYRATDFRLPIKDEIDWEEELKNDMEMDIEEVFICLLFSRFKANTTERHHWTLSGLTYLYETSPEKMIKPTKWFLQNHKSFLTTNLILILEILYDINEVNNTYCNNFKDEFEQIAPSKYYIINYIIGQIVEKEIISVIKSSHLLLNAPKKSVDYFKSLNYRHEMIDRYGFDFEGVVGKYKSSFSMQSYEFLYNRSIEQFVKNIYPSNYLLELINQNLCEDFENYFFKSELYEFINIDYKTIVAQTLSYIKRPTEIPKPIEIKNNWEQSEVLENDWIRLGYFEYELNGKKIRKNDELFIWEGIVFSANLEETTPFSRFRLYPIHLWNDMNVKEYDRFICLGLTQIRDGLENYKIIWLNPYFIKQLNLKISLYFNGLNAKNENDEIVLKYNRWSSNYVGNGDISGIKDEIPRLDGAELLCRKDYFDKICEFFDDEKPYTYRIRIKM